MLSMADLSLRAALTGRRASPQTGRDTTLECTLMPPPSREQAAADAAEELAAYAFIRAWMADDVDNGMLMIKQHHVPPEAALFVMSLVKAASRALLSAEGHQVGRWRAGLDSWLGDGSERPALCRSTSISPGSPTPLRVRPSGRPLPVMGGPPRGPRR